MGENKSKGDGPLHVLTVNKNGKPMMPCHPARARQLLKVKRAQVFCREPFTIQLIDREEFATQDIELKLDPGSKTTGIAVVQHTVKEQKCIWQAHLVHRGHQIKSELDKRRAVRRSRRHRKTRYRKPRFDYRKKDKGWLAPSLISRVNNVLTWVKRLSRLVPITAIAVETARFDMQKIQNPEVSGTEYQQGELMGYELREYLLEKFKRTCIYCGITGVPLEIEHIIPRSLGGSNRVSNLTLACKDCNREKGSQPLELFVKDSAHRKKIMRWTQVSLKDAAAINSIRYRIGDELEKFGLPVSFWSGGRTKMNRIQQNYPKNHWIDAACVGISGNEVKLNPVDKVYVIQATGRGSRKMCLVDKYGFPRSKPKAVKRVHGFQTGDMVRLRQDTGKYKGVYQGKVVIRERGDFDLVRPGEKRITASWRKFELVQRFDGYQYSLASA